MGAEGYEFEVELKDLGFGSSERFDFGVVLESDGLDERLFLVETGGERGCGGFCDRSGLLGQSRARLQCARMGLQLIHPGLEESRLLQRIRGNVVRLVAIGQCA